MTYLQLGILSSLADLLGFMATITLLLAIYNYFQSDNYNCSNYKTTEDCHKAKRKQFKNAIFLLAFAVFFGSCNAIVFNIHESLLLEKSHKESNVSGLIFHKNIGK